MTDGTSKKRAALAPGGHPCENCGEPCPPNYKNKQPRKFCTKLCASRGWAKRNYDENLRVPKEPGGHPCARCGEPVPEKKVGGKARKFCSRECAVAQNQADRGDRHRHYTLAKYGIGVEEYEALRLAQGNRCAICGTDDPASNAGEWHVDHCHESGAVRGLLCSRCNIGLGYFKDDPARLTAAIKYLEAAASA